VGTLLAVSAITICVAGVSFLPSALIAKVVVRSPSRKPRRWAWKFACFITALWPVGVLLAIVSVLDLAVTHKVFGSHAGDNVTFGLILAVVGTFAYAQVDFSPPSMAGLFAGLWAVRFQPLARDADNSMLMRT
jgi:hypothetical protein